MSKQTSANTWNLTPLAADDTDPNISKGRQLATTAIANFAAKWKDTTEYLNQPPILKQALDDYQSLMAEFGINSQEWYYYHLRTAQDQTNVAIKGYMSAADEVATDLDNQLQFFPISLSKVSKECQKDFLQSSLLEPYHYFLKKLFEQGRYILSESEEKILNLVSSTSYESWVRMTSSLLAEEQAETATEDGQIAKKTLPELLSLSSSKQKEVRDQAAQHVHNITQKYAPVATEELNAIISYKKTTDQLRGFNRPDQSRHLADDIESEVVDAMLSSVEKRYDIAHRFYALKARLMGVDKLAYHERNVEYGQNDQPYPFDLAIKSVTEVFTQLDPSFSDILQQFVKNGQLDVYPRPGKSGGAFCAHQLITQPTYVLLNHTDRLQDVLTLAHEMGHAINNELMRQAQPALYFHSPLATAEVASTFMEDFVLEHVANQSDPQKKLAMNMMKLSDDISSTIRQVAAYRFEQELHAAHKENGYLSSQQIGKIFATHMANYMGPSVEQSAGSQNWWVYWSHFRSFFYVYSYASGLLISKSLQAMVRHNPTDIALVKQFLSAGSSQSPKQTFAAMGVMIDQPDFWQLGLDSIELLLQQTEELANSLAPLP